MTFPENVYGKLVLQQCEHCGKVNYPPRELCGDCLSDQLRWQEQLPTAELLATATLHHSLEPTLQTQLPLRIASLKLACGPVVIAFLKPDCEGALQVSIQPGITGSPVLIAASKGEKS